MLAGCELYFGGHDHDGGDGILELLRLRRLLRSATATTARGRGPTCPATPTVARARLRVQRQRRTAPRAATARTAPAKRLASARSDSDCGTGYHCDNERSSCEPDRARSRPATTTATARRPDLRPRTARAPRPAPARPTPKRSRQGYGYCDETRDTCMTGTDPAGTCAATSTCNHAAPTCAGGRGRRCSRRLLHRQCAARSQPCDVAPACEALQRRGRLPRALRLHRRSYTGINCTSRTASACHAGDTNCTCAELRSSPTLPRTRRELQLTLDAHVCNCRAALAGLRHDGSLRIFGPLRFGLRSGMGFEFAETMAGTVELDARAGQEAPVHVRDHARTPTRRATTCATGKRRGPRRRCTRRRSPTAADAEGTITIRPLGQRIIRYELSFLGDDGKRYEMVGQKDIRWRTPLETLTTCPPRSSTRSTAGWRPA